MLPSEIPIFPLPNVVLFPSALLPLHIFEPRYRAMVADALESERLIGMVMLRPGWEPHYDGSARRVSGRMRRLHHARRSAARRPLQHHAARAREIPDPRRAARARRRRALPHRAHRVDQGSEVRRDGGQPRRAAAAREAARAKAAQDTITTSSRRTCPTPISCTRSPSTSSRSKSRRCSSATACSSGAKRWWSCWKCG